MKPLPDGVQPSSLVGRIVMRRISEGCGRYRPGRRHMGVLCRVVDVRNAYGRDEYLIQPIGGVGAIWVTDVSLFTQEEYDAARLDMELLLHAENSRSGQDRDSAE